MRRHDFYFVLCFLFCKARVTPSDEAGGETKVLLRLAAPNKLKTSPRYTARGSVLYSRFLIDEHKAFFYFVFSGVKCGKTHVIGRSVSLHLYLEHFKLGFELFCLFF